MRPLTTVDRAFTGQHANRLARKAKPMWPATAWDEDEPVRYPNAWTVMGRVRDRQESHRKQMRGAIRRQQRRRAQNLDGQAPPMTPALEAKIQEDMRRATNKKGWPSVLAFLFAQPDSEAIGALDARGEYLDIRTGDTWDLFFPGYYRSHEGRYFERECGARPVGVRFGNDWYFSANEFDTIRTRVESSSAGGWRYSGGTDLVLVNVWIPRSGDPVVDWESVQSGAVTDPEARTSSLTVPTIVERITNDLLSGEEDEFYGIREVLDPASDTQAEGPAKRIMIGALGGILAAYGKTKLGL